MAIPIIKMATIGLLPSPLKKKYYQMCGAKIGKHVSFGLLSIINAKDIEIGDYTKIGHISYIDAKRVKIGKRVSIKMLTAIELAELEIGNDSVILDMVTIGGMLTPRSKLIMGERVKIFSFSFINPTEPIVLEDDVGVGGGSYIFTHSSWLSKLEGYPVTFGPVTIHKKVWLAWRVFILPNVEIGENTIIGANAVVTANIPRDSLASGFPAKVMLKDKRFMRPLSEESKDKMVRDICKDFCEFMRFEDHECNLTEQHNTITITTNLSGVETKILYCKSIENGKRQDTDIFVSLKAISPKLRKEISKEGKLWFDIENKETQFSERKDWDAVKTFFSRYGVKFKTLDPEE